MVGAFIDINSIDELDQIEKELEEDMKNGELAQFFDDLKRDRFFFEPILISINTEPKWEYWTNPNIEDMCIFEDGSDVSELSSYRIHIYSKDNQKYTSSSKSVQMYNLEVVVKANSKKILDKYWKQFSKEMDIHFENGNKGQFTPSKKLKNLENKATEFFYFHTEFMLTEDCWSPGNEQFCFSEFGEKVGKILQDDYYLTWSPDISVEKYDDGTYGFST